MFCSTKVHEVFEVICIGKNLKPFALDKGNAFAYMLEKKIKKIGKQVDA